jgi:hypothetical protein
LARLLANEQKYQSAALEEEDVGSIGSRFNTRFAYLPYEAIVLMKRSRNSFMIGSISEGSATSALAHNSLIRSL